MSLSIKLLEGPKLLGDVVEILQADDLQVGQQRLVGFKALLIDEVHGGDIGRIAIGNEAQGFILREGTEDFAHGGRSTEDITLIGDVVGSNLMRLGIEEEEGVIVLAGHTDVGFVTGGSIAGGSFVTGIEEVAVVGRGL